MKINILIIFFSFIGLSFSLFLYLNRPDPSVCSFSGCSTVLNSKFSKTFGIDNSLLGIFYFLAISTLTYLNKDKILKILSIFGTIFAFYLIFIMFLILKEICYYCLIVDFSAIIIFILSMFKKNNLFYGSTS